MTRMREAIMRPVRLAKYVVKRAIGLLPPPRARLTGLLAKDGGLPVRDTRFRPWPTFPSTSGLEWRYKVAPTLRRVFRSGVEGLPQPLASEFSRRWAKYCGTRYALLLPHGTDALRIGLAAALDHDGLDYGGEVIVPNLTFIASANAALDRRLGVAFVDVDPETLTIDPRRVEEAIIPGKTRAIMAVHLFGQPADMTVLREIAQRHSLVLIEDAAQAHGAIHALGPVGSIGDAAGFSFQSSKNLTSGEGGALTTNDSEIFERAYNFHNVGRSRIGSDRWTHKTLGWNCRPTEYLAAVLIHRLQTLEAEQQRRFTRFMTLRDYLADIPCIEQIGFHTDMRRHGVHMFVMRYKAEQCGGLSIKDFLCAVQAEGIPVYRAYESTPAQSPALERIAERHPDYLRKLPTPVADQAVKEIIYIPHEIFLGTEADMVEIAAAFRKVHGHYAQVGLGLPRSPSIESSINAARLTVTKPASAAYVGCKPVRVGVIGAGAMGAAHAKVISADPRMALGGVCDIDKEKAGKFGEQFGCKMFLSSDELIGSGEVDCLVIATPHWMHADLAIAGLKAGLHVVCEKPMTVTVSQADEVLRVASTSRGTFAVVHQYRFAQAYQLAKKFLESGELGAIYRASIIESAWRTETYYKSSPWRGTWKGEGGGVLLNQAPHIVDRYIWLCGMPETVTARCDANLHQIEVEDTASAIFRHANGAHGALHISTVECPAISQMVVSCDRGRITIENGKLAISKLRSSIRATTASDPRLWGDMESETYEIHIPQGESFEELLQRFYSDLLKGLREEAKPACSVEDGRNAVELANAMLLSSSHGSVVPLPLSREEYGQFIGAKVACWPVSTYAPASASSTVNRDTSS